MTLSNKNQQEDKSNAIIWLNSHKITLSKEIDTIDSTIFHKNSNFSFLSVYQIIIPSNIIFIDLSIMSKFSNLKTITVDENNLHYSTKENILYSKSQDILCFIPPKYQLSTYKIPNEVISIESSALTKYSNLEKINVDEGNLHFVSIEGILFTKDLTNLIRYPPKNQCNKYCIPESVTTIGKYAFSDCTNLITITIPTSVTTIGEYAFYECSNLTTITIPTSVTTIGKYAFSNCSNLTSIGITTDETNILEILHQSIVARIFEHNKTYD